MKKYVLVRNEDEIRACFGPNKARKEQMNDSNATSTSTRVTGSRIIPIRVISRVDDAGLLCIQYPDDDLQTTKDQSRWLDACELELVNEIDNRKAAFGMELPTDKLNFYGATSPFGRFGVAKHPLPVGAKVYDAPGFAMVLRDRFRRKFCHFCFTRLVKKAFQCGKCQQVLYCSRPCLERDQVLHDFQCDGLERLDQAFGDGQDNNATSDGDTGIGNGDSQGRDGHGELALDQETFRLALAALSVEHHILSITNSKSSQMQVLAKLFVPEQLRLRNQEHPAMRKSLDQAARFLVSCCPWALEYDHALAMLQRVKANSHPFSLSSSLDTTSLSAMAATTTGSLMVCEAIGLFPLAAMCLNHSCDPNVLPVFDLKTRALSFRAIKPIAANDVVEYSYLSDLLEPTHRRRQLLRDAFGFACKCIRCVPKPASQQEDPQPHLQQQQDQNLEEQETQFLQLLIQCASPVASKGNGMAQLSELDLLEQRFAALLAKSSSLCFSLLMARLPLARSCQRFDLVLSTCEQMTAIWHQEALPGLFPTMQMVHQTAALAAHQLGDNERLASALQELERFRCFVTL